MLTQKQAEIKTEAKIKTYIKHSGWLGVEEVEVEIIETDGERVIVKALRGYPFDMWHVSRGIPSNAKPIFHNDTYWYNAKIVHGSQIIERSNNMQGIRIYPPSHRDIKPFEIQSGSYWFDEDLKHWFCVTPNGIWGNLKYHSVDEHEDKTITVSPSILCTGHDYEKNKEMRWHGYLERGIWREV